MKIKLATLAVASLGIFTAEAATVFSGSYVWGSTTDVTSFAYNGTTLQGVTASNATKVGITSSASSGNFRGSNWGTAAVDPAKYIEFSLTSIPGETFDMTSITFGVGRSGTGPTTWEWRSSVDGYATTISTYTTVNAGLTNTAGVLVSPDSTTGWTGNVLDLSGVAYDNLTTITFRLYGYATEASGGTGGLQGNLSFEGVSSVPEPASALFGAIGLLGILRRRR